MEFLIFFFLIYIFVKSNPKSRTSCLSSFCLQTAGLLPVDYIGEICLGEI